PRITRISRMFFLRSDSESSADLQSAVSQDFILQTDRTCPTAQVSSIGLQIKNLRYSRIQFCATPSGILNTIRFRIGYDYEASTVTAKQTPPRRRFALLPPPSRGRTAGGKPCTPQFLSRLHIERPDCGVDRSSDKGQAAGGHNRPAQADRSRRDITLTLLKYPHRAKRNLPSDFARCQVDRGKHPPGRRTARHARGRLQKAPKHPIRRSGLR